MEGSKISGGGNGVIDLSKFSNCCALEYQIVNKQKTE